MPNNTAIWNSNLAQLNKFHVHHGMDTLHPKLPVYFRQMTPTKGTLFDYRKTID
jgi:hypothetical protein